MRCSQQKLMNKINQIQYQVSNQVSNQILNQPWIFRLQIKIQVGNLNQRTSYSSNCSSSYKSNQTSNQDLKVWNQ